MSMDFELIENLTDSQVDELYSDMVDGDDKLSWWNCNVNVSKIPTVYYNASLGKEYTNYTFSSSNYFWGSSERTFIYLLNHHGYNEIYCENRHKVANYTTRLEIPLGSNEVDIRSYYFYFYYGNETANAHGGQQTINDMIKCDDLNFCQYYFSHVLTRMQNCNNAPQNYVEHGGPMLTDRFGNEVFAYSLYVHCNNLFDSDPGGGDNLHLPLDYNDSGLVNFYLIYSGPKYVHLRVKNLINDWAWIGSVQYFVHVDNYFFYKNGYYVEQTTESTHNKGSELWFSSGINCFNTR